jgi:hypothetical protein
LNLPLDVPNVPAFGRESFKHEIKILGIAHFPSETFYNGTKGKDIEGNTKEDKNKCGIHHWAEHGIAGRGVLIDYFSYAKDMGIVYGMDYYSLSCGMS